MNFHCTICDYKCSKQSDYNKHIMTRKHKFSTNQQQTSTTFVASTNKYVCKCGKSYKERTGLWYHSKKCEMINIVKEEPHEKSFDNQEIITLLLKQNNDLQKQILDICKNGFITNNTTNNNTNNVNSNNKTFNLQVFLNEECKDDMNPGII